MNPDIGDQSALWEAVTEGDAVLIDALLLSVINRDAQFKEQLNNCLTAAVTSRQRESVKALLRGGADVNAQRDDDGMSATNIASSLGFSDIVELLLDHAADIDSRDIDGRTPLYNAVLGDHYDTVTLLVERGAIVNVQRNNGMSPLMAACDMGSLNTVSFLLQQGPDVNLQDKDGWVPLHHACKAQITVDEPLFSSRADMKLTENYDKNNSLTTGALDKRTDVVRALITAGADLNLRRNDGTSPLGIASENGLIEIVKMLVDNGAEITTSNNNGATPRFLAACRGHVEVVKFLHVSESKYLHHTETVRLFVPAGADVNVQRGDGAFPLSVASVQGHTDIVKLLVDNGAEVEGRDFKGGTPLYLAAAHGHIDVVQFLLEQHADVNACNSDGESCLLAAVFGGHIGVVQSLASAGADVNKQCTDGFSPLIIACRSQRIDIVNVLLENGALTEMRCRDGRTALWWAARLGHIDVLEALITRRADIDAVDYRLQLPVCVAAAEGHVDAMKTLIQRGANVRYEEGDCIPPLYNLPTHNMQKFEAMSRLWIYKDPYVVSAKDRDNETALMGAAYTGHLSVVEMAVKCGVEIHARNYDNIEVIDIASYCGYVDIVRYLRAICRNYAQSLSHFSCNSFPAKTGLSYIRVDHYCNTAMHLTTDIEEVRGLLENGADVDAENVDGLRPIHCAVRTGLVEVVELLIQYGANVDAADVFGNRPLHEAVCHGLGVAELLVQRGARLNVQNVDGKTPLHIAIEREQFDVIVFLLKEDADFTLTDVWRNTPLHYLTSEQLDDDRLREYITKPRKNLTCNAFGVSTQSHISALSKTEVSYCKETSVAKPMYTDSNGNTPLHRAVGVYAHLKLTRVSTDVAKTVEFLVKHGADINAQNNDGLTPLHLARGQEAIEACLQHADDQSFTTVDNRGRNFCHLLCILQRRSEVELTTNIKRIISASDAKYSVDDFNRTPLHYACMNDNDWIEEQNWLIAEFLTTFSAKHINKQDMFGRTALHYAAKAGNSNLMMCLKSKSADDTVQDKFDKTADQYQGMQLDDVFLRLLDTSAFIAQHFRPLLNSVQRCFFGGIGALEMCTTQLQKLINKLRDCNVRVNMLNTLKGCRFDYSAMCKKTTALQQHRQPVNNSVQLPTIFKAIQSEVERAMLYLANEISDKDSRFACEVVLVGSAYEGTKVGRCDEFDFNFVLTELRRRCSVCYSPESPPGFVLLKASSPTYDQELFDNNGILDTRILKLKFETFAKQVLSSAHFCNNTGFEFTDPAQDHPTARRGTTSTKLHIQINLAFTAPVNGSQVLHNVSVDIVPALRIDGWRPENTRREDLCQPGDCLIVFTQPQLKYPWIGWTQSHGFITFAPAESRLLRDCPSVVKAAYMILKRMSKYFCQYEFFTSHVIKTALLWCMDENRPTSDCTSSHDSDEVSVDELLRWVRNILRRLLRFAAQDYVPSYFLPTCHQPVWLGEKYLKQFHMRLHQHGLTYKDLFSLNEQQSRDRLLQHIKVMFVFSHVMYWTMLSDTDELELFVPSTINPLAEDDVCTTLLPVN